MQSFSNYSQLTFLLCCAERLNQNKATSVSGLSVGHRLCIPSWLSGGRENEQSHSLPICRARQGNHLLALAHTCKQTHTHTHISTWECIHSYNHKQEQA